MSVRTVHRGAQTRRGVALLREAQQLIAEAAAILGAQPQEGGLWDALDLIASDRAEAEAVLR
jgi:hypothetical protein